jgi:hypothetical protein
MRRRYSPYVILSIGFTWLRHALTVALVLVGGVVAYSHWGPDLGPAESRIQVTLEQIVTS